MPVSSTATTAGAGWRAARRSGSRARRAAGRPARWRCCRSTGCSHHWLREQRVAGRHLQPPSAQVRLDPFDIGPRRQLFAQRARASLRDSGRSKSMSCWSRPTGRSRGAARPGRRDSPASPSTRCQRTASLRGHAAARVAAGATRRSWASGCFRRTMRPLAAGPSGGSTCACSGGAAQVAATAAVAATARRRQGRMRVMGCGVAAAVAETWRRSAGRRVPEPAIPPRPAPAGGPTAARGPAAAAASRCGGHIGQRRCADVDAALHRRALAGIVDDAEADAQRAGGQRRQAIRRCRWHR